jgi:hypothetical protein
MYSLYLEIGRSFLFLARGYRDINFSYRAMSSVQHPILSLEEPVSVFMSPSESGLDRLCGLVVRVPDYRSRGPGFDSRHYQILWEVVRLKRCPLNLVSIIEQLLERKSIGCGLENREYDRRDPSCLPRDTLSPQKLALTSLASGGRSVGIVRSRTQATEYVFVFLVRVTSLYPQTTQFLLSRFLRLAGLWWRYSTPPPRENH